MSRTVAALVVLLAALAGCSGEDPAPRPTGSVAPAATKGAGEGALSLVSMPGNLEEGLNDPRVDWVTPFEKATGCQVTVRQAYSGQQVYDLITEGGFDGGLVPPEVAGRLVSENHVAPVNTKLVDSFKSLDPTLRNLVKKDDQTYGVPYLWGAGLIIYDTQKVPAPTSWGSIFDTAESKPYKGKTLLPDSPLVLADAALYLKSHRRALKIKDPFELTPKQLDAAAEVVAKAGVGSFSTDRTDAIEAFTSGDAVVGLAGPDVLNSLSRGGRPVGTGAPKEGVIGWLDSWMIATGAQHPNCMYQWLNWTSTSATQAEAAEWRGAAPANAEACPTLPSGFCTAFRVSEKGYLDKLQFVRAPTKDCAGDQQSCTDWKDWTLAWATVVK